MCFLYQIVQLFQDHWFELIDPNNLQTKFQMLQVHKALCNSFVDQLRYILIF